MNTRLLLMAQYNAQAVIPLDVVARDYFPHLGTEKLAGKISRGEVRLPMVHIETSAKAARGVHLADLADWIDARREAAAKELKQMTS